MDPGARRSLTAVVKKAMARFDVPGTSIALWHDGREHFASYGVTNIEFPLDVDEHTLFQIGSTTKTITGTIVMRLVEEGLLDLEDPVRKHLPKFRLSDERAAKQVRIKHLVTHLGGWKGDVFDDTGRGADALARIVRRLAGKPQLTPVESVWAYNNAGFYVLGRIIEVVRKKPYEEVVAEEILEPLGMTKSFFFAEDIVTHKAALGHIHSEVGLRITRPWGLKRAVNPCGGLTSTAVDQLRYARFHLGHDLGPEAVKILPRRAIKQMQRPRHKVGSSIDDVGITWLLETISGTRTVRHGGSINGQMSAFMLVPKHDFAITVLTNAHLGYRLHDVVTTWALDKLLGIRRQTSPRKLTPQLRTAYEGTYEMDEGLMHVTSDDSTLVMRLELDDDAKKDSDVVAVLPKSVRLMPTGRDRFVVLDEPWTDFRGDFVRNESGDVVWLRLLGRLHRRISEDAS